MNVIVMIMVLVILEHAYLFGHMLLFSHSVLAAVKTLQLNCMYIYRIALNKRPTSRKRLSRINAPFFSHIIL